MRGFEKKCIRMRIIIFKIFIWEGISSDFRSDITFYGLHLYVSVNQILTCISHDIPFWVSLSLKCKYIYLNKLMKSLYNALFNLFFSFWENSTKSTLSLISTILTLSTTNMSLTNRFCVIKEYVKMWERPERCMLIKAILGTVVRHSDPKRWVQFVWVVCFSQQNGHRVNWFKCSS